MSTVFVSSANPEFPKLGFVKKLQGVCELNQNCKKKKKTQRKNFSVFNTPSWCKCVLGSLYLPIPTKVLTK